MKKSLIPILLGAVLAGCANDDSKVNDPTQGSLTGAEVTGYLSINLMLPQGSRADGDYQYGSISENYVNEVRFYFFDEFGAPVEIRKNPIYDKDNPATGPEYYSYFDWDPTPSENNNYENPGGEEQDGNNAGTLPNNTVEKTLSTMIVLTAKDGIFPQQVVAVVNPTPYVKNLTLNNPTPTLSQIQAGVSDNLTGFTDKNFLMSNSVYLDGEGEMVIAQPVPKDKFGLTQPEAQQHPIYVYVERAIARFNLNMDITYAAPEEGGEAPKIITLTDGTKLYPTQETITTEDRVYQGETAPDGQLKAAPIYTKFLGWAVTSTPTSSYVMKQISSNWGDANEFFGVEKEPWYITAYHRSYWAINPATLTNNPADNSYVWFNYNELSGVNAENPAPNAPIQKLGLDMKVTQTYMQENANPAGTDNGATGANPSYPTKVIFAAQLVDAEGNAIELTEWNGVYYTFQGLKNLAASMLDMYYIKPGTGTQETPAEYVPISPNQITFITRSAFYNENPLFSDTPNYTVYATLTTAEGTDATDPIKNAAGVQWYHLNDNVKQENAKPTDYTKIGNSDQSTYLNTINNYMQAVFGNAKVWKNGYTYYYMTLKHLGAENKPGYFGVVRNHIYSAKIDGLKGLGTPVWDPNEKIYPEQPNPDGNNLSAQVEVLAWRVVSDSYEFEW